MNAIPAYMYEYCLNTIVYIHAYLCLFSLHINHLIFIVKDWMQIIEGIPNATAIQLDVMDHENLFKYVSQVGSFPW